MQDQLTPAEFQSEAYLSTDDWCNDAWQSVAMRVKRTGIVKPSFSSDVKVSKFRIKQTAWCMAVNLEKTINTSSRQP
jgi:hypothetical protein